MSQWMLSNQNLINELWYFRLWLIVVLIVARIIALIKLQLFDKSTVFTVHVLAAEGSFTM